MTVWFTADPHLGHKLVAGLRGFDGPDEHDSHFIAMWHKLVRADDQVWVLGDLNMSTPTYALSVFANLLGRKHLLGGNHDACHPMHRDAHKYQRRYLEVFDSVQTMARRRIAGHDVLLSHFPYAADRGEARYTQYRLADEGRWLLHGHTHQNHVMTSDHEIHVGLDAWAQQLVPLQAIEVLITEAER